ncbi:P-loop containing nucleoside triphosphate hydrolase [Phytophthora cactorum]|nr:P-loop containing nucleoside triphosphate hydrolase [Phytophthora cactorum]
MEQPSLYSRRIKLIDLSKLLGGATYVKVMHDVHRAAFCLHRKGLDVELRNCIDLQVAYENIVDTAELHASMLHIVEFCKGMNANTSLAQTTQSFKAKLRPADPTDAQLYAQCYVELAKMPASVSCGPMSNVRWQYAIENQGHQAIWFDLDADNQPRNLEYFASYNGRMPKAVCLPAGIPTLQLQCELESLLDLLPIEYEDAILAIDDYHNKLVDICLDVGRIPYVYTGKKQRVMLSENGATVTKEIIEEIITNLGGEMRIGDDNRAGIDRQLHRISVMRSKTDEVYGLTMRVGRALRNAACVLTDLLLSDRHADKSVLVLGHPGSGKTTLIRDVARCVSETMENVCIIDTSNEIGGDGLVPHECVGWARRIMVPSLEAQAGVMVECVQNHTVETLIVDEIGRKAEVLAASTVRQRGPRLIASAQGEFRALIKNPDLKGLVGGSQQVIVGDKEAKASNQGKLQTQRASNPIFDVIVELDHAVRGRCRIIWDVAKAVDNVLEGNGYSFETRFNIPMNRSVRPENVEFTVKAAEDLVLTGKERSIVRVAANNMYSCLMQKTQRFSSLFRHYSKHHGLPRESLDFFFTVGNYATDTLFREYINAMCVFGRTDGPRGLARVSASTKERYYPGATSSGAHDLTLPCHNDEAYFATMRELFLSGVGSDITLEVGVDREVLRAHRLILTTRCEIFEAMFRPGAMKESWDGVVRIEDHSPEMVSKMLEFIYTNRVLDLAKLNSNQLIDLLTLSEQYLLLPLKHLCEVAAQDVLSVGNVGRFLCAAEKFNAAYLKEYCLAFFMDHTSEIIDDENFREEIESCPSMALTIVRATTRNSGSSLEPVQKRRRLNMPFEETEYLSPST